MSAIAYLAFKGNCWTLNVRKHGGAVSNLASCATPPLLDTFTPKQLGEMLKSNRRISTLHRFKTMEVNGEF